MPCGKVETPEDILNFAPLNLGGSTERTETPITASLSQPSDDGVDVEMTDANNEAQAERNGTMVKSLKSEDVERPVRDLPQHTESNNPTFYARTNGDEDSKHPDSQLNEPEMDTNGNRNPGMDIEDDGAAGDVSEPDEMRSVRPRRMRTRAQFANPSQGNESVDGDPGSPSAETLNSLPAPHPLFLVPDNIHQDSNFGLPPNDVEDTRRLLWSYIQKQEETVRGFEQMLENLLRVCRMKDDVWEWCNAEGHLGEMSDGEDWYDRERWGLAPGEDLKKGADEDEAEAVDESRGKRGRRRQ